MTEELWKPIPGFEGIYEISNKCRVRSLDRIVYKEPCSRYKNGVKQRTKGKILKFGTSNDYPSIAIVDKNKKKRTIRVHRLYAELWIDNPNNLPVVRHLNDIKTDLRPDNLAWGTYQDNSDDWVKRKNNEKL